MGDTIGSRIRMLRKSKGITGTFLAKKIGISQSVLSQIELDQVRLKADLLPKLCDALEVEYGYFFEGPFHKNAIAALEELNHETAI